MRKWLILTLLFVACFGQATFFKVHSVLRERTADGGGVMALLFGDSRRIFSNHFFAKAEVYFRKGVSTSIFDDGKKGARAGSKADGQVTGGATGMSANWIQNFGSRFHPVQLANLGDTNDVCEMMPWLYLSVEVDPHNIQTYLVAALYLHKALGRSDEAEQLLRLGVIENPTSYELLSELGQLYYDKHQPARARNLWHQAVRCWEKGEAGNPAPDVLAFAQVAARLARVEEEEHNNAAALKWLERAGQVTGNPERFHMQIERLRAKTAGKPLP